MFNNIFERTQVHMTVTFDANECTYIFMEQTIIILLIIIIDSGIWNYFRLGYVIGVYTLN